MPAQLALRIASGPSNAAVVAALRKVGDLGISALSTALANGEPIPVGTLFDRGHVERERLVMSLLEEITEKGARFEILLDGQLESLQYLRNRCRAWHEIAYDIQMETDLELGEPSEEALRWATGNFEYPKTDG